VKEEVAKEPKVIEVKVAEERTEAESKAIEVEKPKVVEVVEETETEPIEEKKVEEPSVEVKEEIEEELTEETPLGDSEEPEPAPKGPPIPSPLPYRGLLCPAGRPHRTHVH
jgi:hypothetical protein